MIPLERIDDAWIEIDAEQTYGKLREDFHFRAFAAISLPDSERPITSKASTIS